MNPFMHLKRFIASAKNVSATMRGVCVALSLALSLFAPFAPASAAITPLINYQGKLLTSSSVPVASGTYQIEFTLYDALTGGNVLWTASGSTASPDPINVPVQSGGLFSILLGDTDNGQNTLEGVDWNTSSLYLGITVGSDSEMTPRKRLSSTPQAFNAEAWNGYKTATSISAGQGGEVLKLSQTSNDAASVLRTVLQLTTSGTSALLDSFLRLTDDTLGDVFTINRQGHTTTTGNLASLGNTFLGDSDADTLIISSRIASDLIPTLSDTFSLGSDSLRWNAFLGTASTTYLSANTLNVTSTLTYLNAEGTNTTTTHLSVTTLAQLPANTTINGQSPCLTDGTGCDTPTLQEVSNAGSFTTTSLTLFGGLTTSDLTATGTTSLQDFTFSHGTGTSLTLNGLFTVSSGLSSLQALTFTNATGSALNLTGAFTFTNATGTSLFLSTLLSAQDILSTNSITINGTNVCLEDGTNCEVIPAATNFWTYDATDDFLRPNTNTTDLVLGAGSIATSPFYFQASATSSRLYLGAFNSTGTNVVLGATTSTITNTAFQLDGNDLFVAGNIGSASSVYTNGAFIAGSGTTIFGDGFITRTGGSLTVSSSQHVLFLPSSNVGIGTSTPSEKLTVVGNVQNLFGTNTSTESGGFVETDELATGAGAWGIAVQGRYAYVTNNASGTLSVIDVSDSSAIVETDALVMTGELHNVAVQGRYAYVTNFDAGTLSAIDVSNPSSIVETDEVATGDQPYGIAVQGRYAYVVGLSVLSVVDVSDPANLVKIDDLETGDEPIGVAVQGRYAYVANNTAGTLSIVDVSNPSNIIETDDLATGAGASSVAIQGRYAYVTNQTAGTLSIVDVSNPSNAVETDEVATGVGASGVAIQGRYAYVTNQTAGTLFVVDVLDPSNAVMVAEIATGAGAVGVAVQGRYAYVTNETAGTLSVVRIPGIETTAIEAHSAEVGGLGVRGSAVIGNGVTVGGGLNVGQGGIFSAGALAVSATSTASTFGGAVSSTRGVFSSALTTIGGQLVCVANGTNCSGGSASSFWTYDLSGDFIRPNTSTVDFVLGANSIATSPFYFQAQTTSSRLYLGAFNATGTNVVLGATTSTLTFTTTTVMSGSMFASSTTYAVAGTSTFVVPEGATSVTVKAWGGGGGGGGGGTAEAGGLGAGAGFIEGTVAVTPGENLTVHVGTGGTGGGTASGVGHGGGGGGVVALFRGTTYTQADALFIAAGGGGGGGGDNTAAGGATGGAGGVGGGVTGGTGGTGDGTVTGGSGGSLTGGGAAGTGNGTPTAGAALLGGNGGHLAGTPVAGGVNGGGAGGGADTGIGRPGGGGGGGGYFGGGGGGGSNAANTSGGGGGGGSSFATSTATATSTQSGSSDQPGGTGISGYNGTAGVGGAGGAVTPTGGDSGTAGLIILEYTATTPAEVIELGTVLFQLDGNDLFVGGNIGSASSVYTNSAFIAGQGNMYYGSGFLTNYNGSLTVTSSAHILFNPSGNVGVGTSTPSEKLTVVGGVQNTLVAGQGGVTKLTELVTNSTPSGIVVQGRYVYLTHSGLGASASGQLSVIDVNNPAAPVKISDTLIGGANAQPILGAVEGRFAYISQFTSSTFSIVDISNPFSPVITSSTIHTGANANPRAPFVQGRYAYVPNDTFNTVSVMDVADPTWPIEVLEASAGGARDVFVQGRYLYMANGVPAASGPLAIFDVSDPLSLPSVGTTPIVGGEYRHVSVQGKYAFLTNFASSTLVAYDVSNPASPTLVGTVSVGGAPDGLVVSGRYAYTANTSGDSVSVVDVRDPANMVQIAEVASGNGARYIAASGRYLYVGNSDTSTMSVFRVSGMETAALEAHSAEVGSLAVRTNAVIANHASVGGGLGVGGASQFNGPVSIFGSTTSTRGTLWVASDCTGLVGTDRIASFADGTDIKASIRCDGQLHADSTVVGSNGDYAEYFISSHPLLVPGDVVVLDTASSTTVTQGFAAARGRTLGVVSARPLVTGQAFLENHPSSTIVGLLGQLDTKVSTLGADAIAVGDLLMAADGGIAMRAKGPGVVLGRAQAPFPANATGTLSVFVNPHWWAGDTFATDATGNRLLGQDLTVTPLTNQAVTSTRLLDSPLFSFEGRVAHDTTSVPVVATYRMGVQMQASTSSQFVVMGQVGDASSSRRLLTIDHEGALSPIGAVVFGATPIAFNGTLQTLHAEEGWSAEQDGFATRYRTKEALVPGDLVVFDPENPGYVKKSTVRGSGAIAGVVSERAGFVAGARTEALEVPNGEAEVTVVVTGNARVRVNPADGPMAAGDALTPSDTPGVAVVSTGAGAFLGVALEAPASASVTTVRAFIVGSSRGSSTGASSTPSVSAPGNLTVLQRGFARVAAGDTLVHVALLGVTGQPVVQAAPAGDAGSWWIANVTSEGFDIVMNEVRLTDMLFSWRVDGTVE